MIILIKQLLIDHHQPALTDRRTCLFRRHSLRPLSESQRASSHADRAGRNHDHFPAFIAEIDQDSDKLLQFIQIDVTCLRICNRCRPHFDHDPLLSI